MSKVIHHKRLYEKAREEFEKPSKSGEDNLWTKYSRKHPGDDAGGSKTKKCRIDDVATTSAVENAGSPDEGQSEPVAEKRKTSRKHPGDNAGGPKRRRICASSVVNIGTNAGSPDEVKSESEGENRQASDAKSSADMESESSESTEPQMSETQIEAALLARLMM